MKRHKNSGGRDLRKRWGLSLKWKREGVMDDVSGGKVNVDLYSALSWTISKALRYGTRSQGISQFYLHTRNRCPAPGIGDEENDELTCVRSDESHKSSWSVGRRPYEADSRDRVMRDGKSCCWPSKRKRKMDERGLTLRLLDDIKIIFKSYCIRSSNTMQHTIRRLSKTLFYCE